MRRVTIALAVLGMAALAIPALAVPPPPDTALSHGFDEENNVLVFGISKVDHEVDGEGCDIDAGTYDYEIDEKGDGSLVDPSGEETTDESGAAAGDDEGCDIQLVDVTGPNGQINHGQVVSSFVHALGEFGLRGRGCVVRTIAQSGYGKGDQQVRPSEVVETDGETTLEGGSVDLESVLATCFPASRSDNDETGASKRGKPDHAGPPDHAGKPDNPGNGNGNGNGKGNGNGNGKP